MRPAASPARRLTTVLVAAAVGLSLVGPAIAVGAVDPTASEREAADPTPPPASRWSAADVECPPGTEARRDEAPDGSRSARWCEMSRGSQVAPHGPYLELYPDGSTARQGTYRSGVQVGRWVSWSPAGEIEVQRDIWPGEASRHIPRPDDLCPPGATRERSRGFDHKRRLWSTCMVAGPDGTSVMTGPYVTWDEQPRPDGGSVFVLREVTTYEADARHGPRRVFDGGFGAEALVEEETYDRGSLAGESG